MCLMNKMMAYEQNTVSANTTSALSNACSVYASAESGFVLILLYFLQSNPSVQVQQAVQALIDKHQKIPGNILRALLERFHRERKED